MAAELPPPAPDRPVAAGPWFLPGLLAILLATLAVLSPLLKAEFVFWDDHEFVTDNPPLARGLTWESLGWALGNNLVFFDGQLEYFSPLTAISRLIDVSLYGPANAPAFHATSLLLHLANVGLLAWALLLLTGRPWRCLAVAGIFALHPLVVEPVGWLSARKDLVYGSGFLVVLLAYAFYVRKPGWRRYLGLSAAFCLACMTKPMVVTLSFCLLLLDLWPLRRISLPPDWRVVGRLVVEKLPFLLLSGGVAFLAYLSQARYEAIVPLEVFSPFERLGNCLLGYQDYLRMFFLPEGFAPLHRYTHHPGMAETILRLAVFVAISIGALTQLRRAPFLAVGWFWFVGVLFPVSGIVQIGAASYAERYMYMPMVGLALAVVWAGAELSGHLQTRPRPLDTRIAVAALWLGWLGMGATQAHAYARAWRNTGTLCAVQLWAHPDTWRFKQAYVNWLINREQLALAWSHLRNFIAAGQELPYAWNTIARVHLARGQDQPALAAAQNAIAAGGGAESEALVGFLLARQQKYPEAIPHLEKSIASGKGASAETRITLAQAYAFTGRESEAEEQFRALVELARTDPRAREILGRMREKTR